ncbi:MAG: ankyrin repeat domain-containing protein [Candidatus Berkiella sp.]
MRDGVKVADLVELGQIDDVKMLIKDGGDVNEADKHGNYPVIIAASRNDLEMLKVLVKAGAKLRVTNEDGDNAATWAKRHNNPEMVNYINEKVSPVSFYSKVMSERINTKRKDDSASNSPKESPDNSGSRKKL